MSADQLPDEGSLSVHPGLYKRVYTPYYYLTDHWGSVRAIVNKEGIVQEQNDYYPFGLRYNMNGEAASNRYLYNGKEAQAFVSLPYTDYGARMYDPRTGRWFNIDLLAEKYYSINPYTYCVNNPIKFVDIYGMDLVRVAVPANADGSATKMIIVDSKAAEHFYKFVWAMNQKYGLIVNSDFRSKTKQAAMRANWDAGNRNGLAVRPAKKSAHSGGFAVDMNVRKLGLSKDNYMTEKGRKIMSELSEFAAEYGIYYGGDFTTPDVPHFYLNETDYGYSSREEAMDVNDKFWQDYGDEIPVYTPQKEKIQNPSYRDFINNNLNNPSAIISYWLSVNPNIKLK